MTQINRVTILAVGLLMLMLTVVYVYISREDLISTVSSEDMEAVILGVSIIEVGGSTSVMAEQNGDNCNDEEIIFMRTNYDDKDFLIDTCYDVNSGIMRMVKAFK